jgi:hypothetical protein
MHNSKVPLCAPVADIITIAVLWRKGHAAEAAFVELALSQPDA